MKKLLSTPNQVAGTSLWSIRNSRPSIQMHRPQRPAKATASDKLACHTLPPVLRYRRSSSQDKMMSGTTVMAVLMSLKARPEVPTSARSV